MTREELEALGMTDEKLVEEVERLFGSKIKLVRLERDDPERAAHIRAVWFDQVSAHQHGGFKLNTPKMGSFGQDNPEEHFGPDGIPNTGDE